MTPAATPPAAAPEANNFLRALIREHLKTGVHDHVTTRFPPEPNGYLHIGHAKSICLNFGLAREFGGACNLRFDDTNPAKEEVEYVEAIEADVRWLGFEPAGVYFASDYFGEMYRLAEKLVVEGKAYVDDLNEAEIREYRGTAYEPGRASPYRDRSPDENLDLLRRMRAGEFPDGAKVLRAKGDMTAANLKLRDPLLYRIRHEHHHRTGDAWCIYPMYDYAHPIEDSVERITHSICTLEFENNRDIYDWVLRETGAFVVKQIEFARLFLSHTVMSKRKLLRLVKEGHVAGWDDPRMPTLAGLRRRGVTPEAIREFCERIGVAKANSLVDIEVLDITIRDDLNTRAPRWMAVLDPLKVIVEDWIAPGGAATDTLDAPHWPHDVPKEGSRPVTFSRELWIDRADFAEEPPPKWHRLAPGREVRLRYGYVVKCVGVDKDAAGAIVAVRCTHDPATRGGNIPDGRKVPGTIHWVSATDARPVTVRLYDRLFSHEKPDAGDEDFLTHLNPRSLTTVTALAEPGLLALGGGAHLQLERVGYFYTDPIDSTAGTVVLNRVVGLKDSWAKEAPKAKAAATPATPKGGAGSSPEAPQKAPQKAPHKRVVEPLTPAQAARAERWMGALGVAEDDAALLSADEALAVLFDDASDAAGAHAPALASFLLNELPKDARGGVKSPAALGRLVVRVEDGTITGRAAKDVLAVLLAEGGEPDAIIEAKGLRQVSDRGAIEAVVRDVIARNPGQLAAYRGGRGGLLGFFVGEVMKATRGAANPALVQELVRAALA
ncbi:MAG: glutamine--tRNA ligase/YqeY domain fusion protein [Pseudomonadota bacterium]|nr:glutamine--tRNA ligase/YqeY domain fusion protein [Pseudomonadota bacterium]